MTDALPGHPPRTDNPHTYLNDEGNPVTVHTTEVVPVEIQEEGEPQWPTPPLTPLEAEDGTDSSTSSDTETKPSDSGETPSPKPAPTTGLPSEQDPTEKSTAPSTDGDGTEPQNPPSPPPTEQPEA